MRHLAALSLLALGLAGCASMNQSAWVSEPDAKPFDEAASQCRGQQAISTDRAQGMATLALCMGEKGWRKR